MIAKKNIDFFFSSNWAYSGYCFILLGFGAFSYMLSEYKKKNVNQTLFHEYTLEALKKKKKEEQNKTKQQPQNVFTTGSGVL